MGSVATRREVLLSNDKSDFVTISVVTSLDPPVGSADSSRSVYAALLDGLRPSLPAARSRRTSQMLCALPSAPPTLIAGHASTSRRTLSVTYRGILPPLFSACFLPLLAASFRRTSRQFHRHFSNVYSLPGSSAAPFPPSWNIAAFNSASDKVPPAESAKSFSTLGRSDSFSAENLPR